MKAIVFDFKQSIKPNIETTKEINMEKNKNFSSTLESINSKIDKNNSSKNKLDSTKTEDSNKANKTEKPKVEDAENLEPVEVDKEDKEKKIVYENLLFLSNNMVTTVEDKETTELIEKQEIVEVGELTLENKDLNMEDLEDNSNIVENNFDFESLLINKDKEVKYNLNLENQEIPEENTSFISKEIKPQPKVETNEITETPDEEISLETDVNSKLVTSVAQEETKDLENNNSKEMSSKDNIETSSVNENSKEDKINNESLFTLGRQDVEYTKNISTELEKSQSINPKEVIEQIVEKVKIDLTGEKNEIRIRLKPEILGEMLMNIEVTKNALIAKVMVDNQRTKEIIEANLVQLREEMKDSGLEIKTFEVFVGNGSDFDRHNSSQFNFNQNNKKIKIKADNKKVMANYEEKLDMSNKIENIHSENSLDLMA